jgi:hypothetical protein
MEAPPTCYQEEHTVRTIEVSQRVSLVSGDLAQVLVADTEIEALPYMRSYLNSAYRERAIIRLVRGHKARNLDALFDECAAALQFPIYFGENWAAFTDCLRDLPRANPLSHLLLVANAGQLLCDQPQQLSTLFEILQAIPADWAALYPPSAPRVLKVVLQEGAAGLGSLTASLDTLGLAYDRIHADWLQLLK